MNGTKYVQCACFKYFLNCTNLEWPREAVGNVGAAAPHLVTVVVVVVVVAVAVGLVV